jgi:hypothetical protein
VKVAPATGGAGVAVAEPKISAPAAIPVTGLSAAVSGPAIPLATIVALALATILTIALGIVPGGLYHVATQAARALLP